MNDGAKSDFSESPKRAIVSLENGKNAEFDTYINVYTELKIAYQELWNEMAQKKLNQSWDKLDNHQQIKIKSVIPMVISEADPHFGERQ